MLAIMADRTTVGVHLCKLWARPNHRPDHPAGQMWQRSRIMQTHLLEEAAKVIACSQVLVNVISKRVRELANGHRPLVEVQPRMGLADIALSEVIERKLTYEHTAKSPPVVAFPGLPKVVKLTVEKKAA